MSFSDDTWSRTSKAIAMRETYAYFCSKVVHGRGLHVLWAFGLPCLWSCQNIGLATLRVSCLETLSRTALRILASGSSWAPPHYRFFVFLPH